MPREECDGRTFGAVYHCFHRHNHECGECRVMGLAFCRGGRVIDENAQDPDTVAICALNDKLMADERVYLAMLKNSDGITIAYKK
jgi:hypothetical protein